MRPKITTTLSSARGNGTPFQQSNQVGKSQYDTNITPDNVDNLNELRSQRQSGLDKFGNGLANMTTSAFTGALESTIGAAYAITAAFAGQSPDKLWKNEFTDSIIDPLNNWTKENMPFYYSQREQNASLLGSMGYQNFWFDKVMGGAGYTFGSLAAGFGMSKLFQMSKAAALGEQVLAESAQPILNGMKTAATKAGAINMAKQFGIGMTMAHGESAMEARQTYDEMINTLTERRDKGEPGYEQLTDKQIAQYAEESANTNYLFNLAITGPTDMLLLGKFINPGSKKAVREYNKIIKVTDDAGNVALKDATLGNSKRGLINAGAKFLQGFVTEGGQEGGQFASNIASKEFVESHNILKNSGWLSSVVDGLGKGIEETLSTKEGLENILIGGIVGGPFGMMGAKSERVAREANTQKRIEQMLKDPNLTGLSEKGKSFIRATNWFNSAENNLQNGNMFEAKNAEANGFKEYVQGYINTDSTDVLIEKLETLKQAPDEEFNQYFGFEEKDQANKDQVINKLVTEIKNLQELHDNINEIYGVSSAKPNEVIEQQVLKDRLFDTAFNIKNIEKREKQIADELQKITGAGELLRLREKALKAGKYDIPSEETYKDIIGDRSAIKYRERIKELTENYRKEYNEKVKEFTKDYPVDATLVKNLLEDLNKLAERREKFIETHNALVNPKKRKEVLGQELAELAKKQADFLKKKQEEEKLVNPQTVTSENESKEIIQDTSERTNVVKTPQGTEVDIAKMTDQQIADTLSSLETERFESVMNGNDEVTNSINAYTEELIKEKERRANGNSILNDLRLRYRNATTVAEKQAIIEEAKAKGFPLNAKFVEADLKKTQAEEDRAAKARVSFTVNKNFFGAREFFEIVFYDDQQAQRKRQSFLDNPSNTKDITLSVKKQKPEVVPFGKDGNVNPNLKKVTPEIQIDVLYNGVPIGYLAHADMYWDIKNNKSVNIQTLNQNQYDTLFNPGSEHTLDSFKRAAELMDNFYEAVKKELGTNETVVLDYEFLQKYANIGTSVGSFDTSDSYLSLDVFKPYADKDGNYLIVDSSTEERSELTSENTRTKTYATTHSDAYTLDPTNLAAGKKVKPELKEAFQQLSDIINNNKNKNLTGRYWILSQTDNSKAIEINGKHYEWIHVTPKVASRDEISNMLAVIKEALSKGTLGEKERDFYKNTIKDLIFISSKIGESYRSSVTVNIMPKYKTETEEEGILISVTSDIIANQTKTDKNPNGNKKLYFSIPFTEDPEEFIELLEKERQKLVLLNNLRPFTESSFRSSIPKNITELGAEANTSFVSKVSPVKVDKHLVLNFKDVPSTPKKPAPVVTPSPDVETADVNILDSIFLKNEANNNVQTAIDPRIAEIEQRRKEELNKVAKWSEDSFNDVKGTSVKYVFEEKEYTSDTLANKAVNAKYDAELAALNQPTTTSNVQTTPVVTGNSVTIGGVTRDMTPPTNDNSGTMFSREKTTKLSAEELIDIENAREYLKSILPSYIGLEVVDTIINNVMNGYTTYGQFRNNLITLSREGKTGTEYHEAFHAIFRTCLTDVEHAHYLKLGREQLRKSLPKGVSFNKAFSQFMADNPEAEKLELQDQINLFVEEYLADEFKKYKLNKPSNSIFDRIFKKIKAVINFFTGNQTTDLESFFERIDKGFYKNGNVVSSRLNKLSKGRFVNQRVLVENNPVLGPKYLSSSLQTREINTIVAGVLSDIQQYNGTEEIDLNEYIDNVISIRAGIWTGKYIKSDEKGKEFVADLAFAYNSNYSKKQIKQEVLDTLETKYNIDETSDILSTLFQEESDESPERNFADNQENQGGFGSLSQALRKHIATTTYEIKLNDLFNSKDFPYDETITVAVDPKKVYDGLTRACQNETDPLVILSKMAMMMSENTESKHYIDRLQRETGFTVNPNSTVDVRTVKEEQRSILLRAIKGFNLFSLNYVFTSVDPFSKLTQTLEANRRDVDKIQVDKWSINYVPLKENNKAGKLDILSALKTYLTQKELIPDDVLPILAKQLKDDISAVLGINLSEGYIKQILLSVPGKTLTPSQEIAVNNYSNQIKYKNKDLIESIDSISYLINTNKNPFKRTHDEKGKEDLNSGAVGRLEKIAMDNAIFDESVEQPTFVNAEGKTIYAFQHGTYHISKIMELAKTTKEDLVEEAKTNPFTRFKLNNFLLNSPAFNNMQGHLKIRRQEGLRERALSEEKGEIKTNVDRRVTEGITYGSFGPREFLLAQFALYVNTKTDLIGENKKIIQARDILITVMEASNTGDMVTLPVIDAIGLDGSINKSYIEAQLNILKNEHDRIVRVRNGEFNDHFIQNFNRGEKRGLHFWSDNKLMLDFILKDPSINTNGVTLDQLEKADNLDAYQEMLIKGIEKYLNYEIDQHVAELVREGIISIDAEKNIINHFLPKAFSEKIDKNSEDAVFPTDNIRANIAQVFLSNKLNTHAINELIAGDPALGLKNFTDKFKRDRGNNASGMNTVTIDWENNSTKNDFNYIVFGNYNEKKDQVEDPTIENHAITSKNTVVKILDYNGNLTEEFTNFAEENKLTDEEIEYLKNNKESIDVADAQGYGSIGLFRDIYESLGRMTKRAHEIFDKVEKGISIDPSDHEYLKDNNIMLNSLKMVYYDGENYVKLSIALLSKDFTSYKDSKGNWKPRKGQVWQHNLLEQMETKKVHLAGPTSMSKKMIMNPVFLGKDNQINVEDKNLQKLNRNYFRLQQENPSNKIQIKDPTQMLQILLSEQNDAQPVNFYGDPSVKNIGDLKKKYGELLGERVIAEYLPILNVISTLKNGKQVPNLKNFLASFRETLMQTGASDKLLDLLEINENTGEPLWNFNLPDVVQKFEEMFNAHFNNALSLKVPGYKTTLQSGFGHDLVINKKTGEIITRDVYDENPEDYETDEYITRPLEYNAKRLDEKGNVLYHYAECILPYHFREQFNLKPGDKLPDELAYMFGVRIPSQDKHSALVLRVVDFLPPQYGSNAVFPHEIVLLTGSDFDIDSFYIHRPDHYVKDGQFYKYGNNQHSKYEQYLIWQNDNNKQVKALFKQRLKVDEDFSNEYFRLKGALAQANDQISKLNKEKKSVDKQLIEEAQYLKEKFSNFKQEFLIETLKSLNLPSNEKQFNDSRYRTPGVINNELLEAKMILHSNPYMAKEINKTPASLKAIDNKEHDNGVLNKLAIILGYKQEKDGKIKSIVNEMGLPASTSSLSGLLKAFSSNKAGSTAIGAAVNSTQLYSFLSQYGISRNYKQDEVPVIIHKNGKVLEANKISAHNFTTVIGERIMDILSTLTSSMTDNAKHNYNSKLNYSLNTLGTVSYGVMTGIDLETMTFNLLQDSVVELTKLNDLSVISSEQERTSVWEKKKQLLTNLEKQLEKLGAAPYEEKEGLNFDDLVYCLNIGKLSRQYVEGTLDEKLNIEDALSKDARYIRTQIAAIKTWEKLSEDIRYLNNAVNIIKLTKGVTSNTDRSFSADDDVINSLSNLNIEGYIDNYGKLILKPYDDKFVKFDILNIFLQNPLVMANLRVFYEKQNLSKQLFIAKTNFADDLRDVISNNMPNIKKVVRMKMLKTFRRNFESFLSIKAFRKKALENGVDYSGLNEILVGDLPSQIDDFIKSYPNFKTNYFIQSLTYGKKPGTNAVFIEYNTRAKGNAGFTDKIRNDANQLFLHPEGRKLMRELFKFAMAKDALQYKQSSIVGILPIVQFRPLSDLMTEFLPELNNIHGNYQKIFGMSRKELMMEFLEMQYRDTNFYRALKQIKFNIKNTKADPNFLRIDKSTLFVNYRPVLQEVPGSQESNKKLKKEQKELLKNNFGFIEEKDGDFTRTKLTFPFVIRVKSNKGSKFFILKTVDKKSDFEINKGFITGVEAEYEETTSLGTNKINIFARTKKEAEDLNDYTKVSDETASDENTDGNILDGIFLNKAQNTNTLVTQTNTSKSFEEEIKNKILNDISIISSYDTVEEKLSASLQEKAQYTLKYYQQLAAAYEQAGNETKAKEAREKYQKLVNNNEELVQEYNELFCK